jgi:hypothetical protein
MPWPYVQVGHVARVKDGPLCGLTGIVVKIRFGMKLVLSISLLRCSMAVEIDRSWISPTHAVRPPTNQAQSCRSAPPTLDLSRLEATPGRQ